MVFIKKLPKFCQKIYHGCYEDFYEVIISVIQAFVPQ